MQTVSDLPRHLTYPRLRENVWHIVPSHEEALLITADGQYEVPTEEALTFLKMRSYCNGHHTLEAVAERSGLSLEKVRDVIQSLDQIQVVRGPEEATGQLDVTVVRQKFKTICDIWAGELQAGYIGNDFVRGDLPKEALIGWLLEMYHYISDFPHAIQHAANHAEGELKKVLDRYAQEEMNHDVFVLRTLEKLGVSEAEARASTPMLSTRMIGFTMRELYEIEPSTVLMVAAMLEAQEFNEEAIEHFKQKLAGFYGIDPAAFKPYFDHQEIDVGLGHAELLNDNLHLIEVTDVEKLNVITNKLHDIKHAFDLQGVEIREYYQSLNGKYIPRQKVDFAAI
ncbi:iron-containing redox enzyme family protein [Acanthopleuribacter pedis]|uniref:Iron-containing redox enzyme family protein n=1 Tax=Acanthopleuribacter pedis TaxID=442870 RepID=A0A8J7Q9H4_9BACT|nr:iron-containing redox enzyme family protein [Acanthopleuribacter pedis]MBO1319429.1 iron-containing redox enzyme family protein [Acanthopleuribacter pedis]